jgi:hypothetical protein
VTALQILYVGRARKDLDGMDAEDRRRIDAALRRLASENQGGCEGEYSIHVGQMAGAADASQRSFQGGELSSQVYLLNVYLM